MKKKPQKTQKKKQKPINSQQMKKIAAGAAGTMATWGGAGRFEGAKRPPR